MYMCLWYLISIIVVMIIMMLMITILTKKSTYHLQKSSPFECGFNPMSMKRMPFSIHFFMIAIIFLIFDVEIIILMPSIFTMKLVFIKHWILSTVMFIMILAMGLYYEWLNGLLNWEK